MGYYPEGTLIDTTRNRQLCQSIATLGDCIDTGEILEGRALVCDAEHNLIVELPGGIRGIIPRNEGAIGIQTGQTRDIAVLSRVNKPVCFTVTSMECDGVKITPMLSRKNAQMLACQNYIRSLASGQVIDAKVTHLEPFGAFVDICCGISSLIPIDAISVSRISHPRDRFCVGQSIKAIVKYVENDRVFLTHKELLGTWEENAAAFEAGQTVAGIVRSVEDYGIFVELAPNLAGLAEMREGVRCNQHASVYIKSLIPAKMKIKLIIIDAFDASYPAPSCEYFITEGVLKSWRYSPESSDKIIETVF